MEDKLHFILKMGVYITKSLENGSLQDKTFC